MNVRSQSRGRRWRRGCIQVEGQREWLDAAVDAVDVVVVEHAERR